MTFTARMILILTLLMPFAAELAAQETSTTDTATTTAADTTTTAATTTATETPADGTEVAGSTRSSYEVRNQFTTILRRSAPELTTILAHEPSLLANDAFLAQYPDLARFVAEHPEIRTHGRFYLAEFPTNRRSLLDEIIEPMLIFAVFALVAFALAWLIRTVIEQKRWNRLSKTQSEVHNKILDRFGTTAELLEYVKTPAGTKFLESAPIPLHAEAPSSGGRRNLPMNRVLWSIQLGVVVAIGGLGMLLISLRHADESGEALFVLGAIALSVGAGFIASAAVTLLLSRRLGILERPTGESELVQ